MEPQSAFSKDGEGNVESVNAPIVLEDIISKRGKIIARLVPEKPKSKQIDWAQSAALRMERRVLPILTAAQSKSLLADSQGSFEG